MAQTGCASLTVPGFGLRAVDDVVEPREEAVELEGAVEPEWAVGAGLRPHVVSFQALCDTHW